MAGFNREDWEDLNITREEVENLTQALKKEEFRKLLAEYAEEITDPKNRKQYQDDIVQLEAERGVDCTFINPEPGFVVKTSVDGKKKAFVNICKNSAVGRPNYKREFRDNTPGLCWSIPLSQSPNREDFDNKRNRCSVYDVVFHPDTLRLAEKNSQFKKMVIDTALNAIEDSYKVKLDKKNLKFPKLQYKGTPFATVIRRKSKNQPTLTDEDIEFNKAIKYPFKPPQGDNAPVVKNYQTPKEELSQKYCTPKYVIKHRSDIDLQEYTYDKNAKINATIPKEFVIEINLPLLNSTSTVNLDIMEKSLHLLCEKPVKYKLDLQLPYSVSEETGNAKFDKERRLLIVTLPVVKAKLSFRDLMREDSGVESDLSPVGSISNQELSNIEQKSSSTTLEGKFLNIVKEDEGVCNEDGKLSSEESEGEKDHRTKVEEVFLDSDKHYLLPAYSFNVDDDKICFVLNVKNVDPCSLVQKSFNSSGCHIKFFSIGSGFFPVYYAFLIDFKEECNIKNLTCDVWDNNVTVLIELVKEEQEIRSYYVGLDEDSLVKNILDHPVELKKIMEEVGSEEKKDKEKENESSLNVKIKSANVEEVVISVAPEKQEGFLNEDDEEEDNEHDDDDDDDDDDDNDDDNDDDDDEKENETSGSSAPDNLNSNVKAIEEKSRTFSESSAEEIVSQPFIRKSILKKRIYRSLSESNADDYCSSSVDKIISNSSDLCVHEEHEETSCSKKTVRFNDHIRQQLFRVNSSILGRKNKNKKKSRNKRKAMERRLSESENSEPEDKERDKKTKKSNKSNKSKSKALIKVVQKKNEKENGGAAEPVTNSKSSADEEEEKPKYGLKKDDPIFEFKSDLIFDLDM